MKKLLAILLALAVIGGAAFAQITVAATASGGVQLIDQDTSAKFARDGSGYDVLTFKAAKDKTSFTANLDNFLNGYTAGSAIYAADNTVDTDAATAGVQGDADTDLDVVGYTNASSPFSAFRDWNFTTSNEWGKFIVGKTRNADFRSSMAYGYYAEVGATRRFFGGGVYGAIFETTGLGALTLGLGLPIPEAGADTIDTVEKTNVGVKYAIDGVGTIKALAELNFTSGGKSRFAASADITAVENLAANVYFMFDTNGNGLYVAGNAYYTMDKLAVNLEAEYLSNWGGVDGPTVGLKAIYTLADPLSVFAKFGYDIDGGIHAKGGVDYDFVPGLTAEVQAGYDVDAVAYDATIYYSLSF